MNKSNTTEKVITSVFTLIIGVLLLTGNWSTFINWYVMVVIIGIVVTLIAAAIFED